MTLGTWAAPNKVSASQCGLQDGVGNSRHFHFHFPAWQCKTGVGNCRQLPAITIPLAIAGNLSPPTRAPVGSSGRALEKAFMPPARVGCMWHPKHIKSSSGTVRLKFQTEWRAFYFPGAKNPWQQPFALWAAQKPGSGISKMSVSTSQRGTEKQGSEIAGNCQQLPCRQLPRRFPPQPCVCVCVCVGKVHT